MRLVRRVRTRSELAALAVRLLRPRFERPAVVITEIRHDAGCGMPDGADTCNCNVEIHFHEVKAP